MPFNVTEDDQLTVKRYYQKSLKSLHAKPQCQILPDVDKFVKKPLKDFLDSHHTEILQRNYFSSKPLKELKSLQNSFQILPSQHFQNTAKLTQKIIQTQDVSKYCMRLFTFMESTQKDKNENDNKENLTHLNVFQKQNQFFSNSQLTKKSQNFLKVNNSQKPLKQKYQLNNKNQQKQKNLLSFIENSRKKREQLLNQLQKLNLNDLQVSETTKINDIYSARQTQKITQNQLKLKAQTSRNSLKKKEFYFKNTFQSNKRMSKNKENQQRQKLKRRRLSLISLQRNIQTISPKTIKRQRPKSARNSTYNHNLANKHTLKPIKIIQDQKFNKANNKNKNKINLIQNKSMKKVPRQQKNKETKNIQKLILKKKQLQNQLLNINQELVLFNKKRSNKPTKMYK